MKSDGDYFHYLVGYQVKIYLIMIFLLIMKEIIFLTDFKQNSFDINNKSKSRDFLYGIDMLKDTYKIKTIDIGGIRISQNIFIKFISKISFVLNERYLFLSLYSGLQFH